MTQVLQTVQIGVAALDPSQADLRVTITCDGVLDSSSEIRGRLMGPRCLYSSTVRIAYPLRPFPGTPGNVHTFRVLIPDPSLWDPQSPFWYEGPLELRQEGVVTETRLLSIGLRWLQPGPEGLRINGRRLPLQARQVTSTKPEDLASWRQQGINLLLVSARVEMEPLCHLADRQGFLVLGQLERDQEPLPWQHHPCLLGWIPANPEQGDLIALPIQMGDAPMVVQILPA